MNPDAMDVESLQSQTQEARENLAKLGFGFRIEGVNISDANWLELYKLSHHVIGCASQVKPEVPAVYIDTVEAAPNAAGYITDVRKVHKQPYWISKDEFPKWATLRDFLDDLGGSCAQ